jgi:hypothetical protein
MIRLEKLFDGHYDFEIKRKIYQFNDKNDINLEDIKPKYVDLICRLVESFLDRLRTI